MTFQEAMAACRKRGVFVREKQMGVGWKIFYSKDDDSFFCLNPHTGSNYGYLPTKYDKLSHEWSIVE